MHFHTFCIAISIMQGTDQTMLNKLHKTHGDNINYLKPKSDMNASFGMNHFAGVVFYDARGKQSAQALCQKLQSFIICCVEETLIRCLGRRG